MATDLDAIEEDIVSYIQRLTAAHESLNVTNQEVQNKNLLKTDELDRELEKITEYQDAAIGVLSRLDSRLKKIRRKQNPTTSNLERSSLNMSSSMNCSLKLPKLHLKKFDGNYQDWLPFWEQFRSAIHENGTLTSSDKFSYLESVLVGNAKKIIAGFTASGMCYEAAVSLLQEQFGDTERLVDKNMQHLISLRPVQSGTDACALRNLYNSVTSCCRTLTALQIPTQHYYVMLKSILLRCLPPELRVNYYRLAERDDHAVDADEADDASTSTSLQIGDKQVKGIMSFLKREVESLERSNVENSRAFSSTSSTSHARHPSSAHTTAACLVSMKETNICVLCASDKHTTKDCDCKLSITEKREILRKGGRCFRCANRGHSSKKCRTAKWLSCAKCKGKHLTSLCDPSYIQQKVYPTSSATTRDNLRSQNAVSLCAGNFVSMTEAPKIDSAVQIATNLCASNSSFVNSNVFLKTARGIAADPSEKKYLIIRFVIDGGSQFSYIREDLVRKLNLQSVGEVNFSLISFGCKEKSPFKKFKKVKVCIKSQFSSKRMELEAVVVPEICIDVLHAPDASCELFQNLQLADSNHGNNEAVDGLSILIGSDYYWSAVSGKQQRISPGLRAVETIFGWTLQGTYCSGKTFPSDEYSYFPSIHSTALHLPVLNYDDLTSFWSLEAIGIRCEEEENEQLAEKLITKCIKKVGQRYEASLPWKNPDVEVKSNKENALRRLKSLSTRLSRYPEQFAQYDAGIQQLLADGVAEPIPPCNEVSNLRRVFYLPHRPVYKANSLTTKMRIVFDASSRTLNTPALNDLLHVGANLLPDVLKILLNFRLGRFGIVADVEKAFLQIQLNEKDRDSHRFLWYGPRETPNKPKQETEPEIVEYRMTRVTFGVNCSPFLLTATLRLHLKHMERTFQSTCRVLMDSFYMDDLAVSVNTEDECKQLSEEAVLVMEKASMNLRKWNTNSAVARKALCLGDAPSKQNVLGLSWYIHSDEIAVPLESINSMIVSNLTSGTKRNVLQMIARIYDPLGMLGPVVIKIKILFQSIWREKLSWDEMLSPDLLLQWEDCVNSLRHLKGFAIQRAVIPFSSSTLIHVHIFADASMKAYGTVAFVKGFNSEGDISVSFLCSKSRVAPLKAEGIKELSLPKLELTAALLAARICSYLKQSLKVKVDRFYLWTDSKIALGWIQGDIHRWKPYVQNRVMEIRHLTSIADWRYCRGKENPADLLTRGVTAHNLLNSYVWVHGPTWLNSDTSFDEDRVEAVSEIVAPVALLTPISIPVNTSPEPLLAYREFSSWSRLVRRTAFILRFVRLCRKGEKFELAEPSASELHAAEAYWIRFLQINSFANEILLLQKEKSVPKTSKIAQLCPFLDEDGFLRLGGRLQSLEATLDQKHPILLPSNSYLVQLIIDDYHQKTLHGGVNVVLCQLRERFWIIKSRPLIKGRIKRCVICQKFFGKPVSQPFGPLPIERIALSKPFDCVGIDFAGPLYFCDSSTNQMKKSYLMVFTCAAIRSVHLEIVTNLSTESCIMGLRRFISRRGTPSTIFSDNARTFRRAALELNDNNQAPNDELMQGFLSTKRIRWKFIVERAPWWGGFWERLIRTIKNVLKVVIGRARMTFDQLRTVIVEAEGIVNLRPLSYISSDPLDISPLTPSHFLHGPGGFSNPEETSPTNLQSNDIQLLWKQRLKVTNMLWNRWRTEYLQQLRSFHHSQGYSSVQLKPNDVVLVFDSAKPRIAWRLAVIETTLTGRDGRVRACELRYADGSRTRRPVQLLYPLELASSSRAEDVKN